MARTLGYLLPYLRAFRWQLLLIGLCLALQTAHGALIPLSFRFLIDRAIVPRDWGLLGRLVGVLVIASAIAGVVAVWRDYLHAVVGAGVVHRLRERMFGHLQSLSMDFYSRAPAGDVLARFSTDLVATEGLLFGDLPDGLIALAALGLNLALLFVLEWRLALLSALVLPLCLIGPRLLSARVLAANARAKQAVVAATSLVQETLGAEATIRAFGYGPRAEAEFARRLKGVRETTLRAWFLGALVERTPILGVWLLQLLIIGVGGALALQGSLSIGSLVSFQGLLLNVSNAVAGLTAVMPALLRATGGLQRIHDLLREPLQVQDAPGAGSLTRLANGVELRGVTFGYVPERPVLRDVSFTVPAGSRVAVVGPNGSGKSTLVSLLLRFYDPASGAVLWDTTDVRTARQDSLRAQIGIVLQETFLFDTTIRENLRIGRPDATDEEVEAAARAAEIDGVIASLPDGYDTVVGPSGSRLSAGQRQRLALARALLRRPSILILDEATSSVDAPTEAAIMETLADIARGLTVVTVTHRLANIAGADQILVMEHGRLVEQGTHSELAQRSGVYARLWHKQNAFTVDEAHVRAQVDVSWLKEIPLLSGLAEARLAEIAGQFVPEGFLEDRTVIRQGDPGDTFYIIARGMVEVVQQDGEEGERRIATLEDGDCFGEIALIRDVPRTATVRTLTPCVLLTLRRSQFLALLAEAPSVGEAVEQLTLRAGSVQTVLEPPTNADERR